MKKSCLLVLSLFSVFLAGCGADSLENTVTHPESAKEVAEKENQPLETENISINAPEGWEVATFGKNSPIKVAMKKDNMTLIAQSVDKNFRNDSIQESVGAGAVYFALIEEDGYEIKVKNDTPRQVFRYKILSGADYSLLLSCGGMGLGYEELGECDEGFGALRFPGGSR